MAYSEQSSKSEAITAPTRDARAAPPEVLEAKPQALTREEFEQLYKSVTGRISKTLALLAK